MKKIDYIILGIIVLFASILRFWQLGHIPIAPNWDEAALGYNAYSILNTGKDEYGKFLPIILKSFDDYKPALYAYLVIPFIKVLGLNIFAIRLVSAIFGIFTIISTFFLVKEVFNRKDIAFLTTLLLAISPWHIQFSRVGFEANVGLAFNVFALLFFFKALKKNKFLLLSSFFAALSLYVYQAERLFVPLFGLILLIIFREQISKFKKKYLYLALLIGLLTSLPFLITTVKNPNILARAKAASILSAPEPLINLDLAKRNLVDRQHYDLIGLFFDNRRVVYAKDVVNHYLSHYDINWLFIQGETVNPLSPPLRKQTIGMGNLYLIELPFILLGLYLLFFGKFDSKIKKLIIAWIIIVPIPAAITWDTPNSIRTLNFLPVLQIIISIGILGLCEYLKALRFKYIVVFFIMLIALFNFIYYLDLYFVQYNYFGAQAWQYGYDKIIPKTENLKNNYKEVIVSNQLPLDQSYIFFLFNLKYSPVLYQNAENTSGQYGVDHRFDKYSFVYRKWEHEKIKTNILYILTEKEWNRIDKTGVRKLDEVRYPNGNLLVVIFDKT